MTKLSTIDGCDLFDVLDLADVLDQKASEIRRRLQHDPSSLPVPIVFYGTGLIRWPAAQIRAWIKAGEPRDYAHAATEFVPAGVARFHDPHALLRDPTSPVSDPRIASAILDGEAAVEYDD